MKITIELTEEQEVMYRNMIVDSLLSPDIFNTECSGHWMCAVVHDKARESWLVAIEGEADESALEEAKGKYLEGVKESSLPKGYKIWNWAKAEIAMNYGIAQNGLEDWLDGTASDAWAIDDGIQMAMLGNIIYWEEDD